MVCSFLQKKLGGKVVPAGQTGNSEYGQSTLHLIENSELLRKLLLNKLF